MHHRHAWSCGRLLQGGISTGGAGTGGCAGHWEMLFEAPHTTVTAHDDWKARLIHAGSGAEKGY